jgi:hypothetical protein
MHAENVSSMLQFVGLAIMPFALLVLPGGGNAANAPPPAPSASALVPACSATAP